MTPLQLAIIVSLLLAGIATAMSALIQELTVVGIWGIPVFGFAIIVAAIFRLAVYYDPRVSNQQLYAGYVAALFISYLVLWSTLDLIFMKGRKIETVLSVLFSAIGILTLITIAEYAWITGQTPGNVYPTFCEIRRFFFFNSSTLLVIGYLLGAEALIRGFKPIVIFFNYSNVVYFAALYSGILHEQTNRATNGSIAEGLKTWFRSRTQPGELFSSVHAILLLLIAFWLFVEIGWQFPTKYRLIPNAVFVVIVALSFYAARRYDPRKAPETSNLLNRLIAIFAHFGVGVYLELYIEFIRQTNPYSLEVHSVTLIALVLLRMVSSLWMIFHEISPDFRAIPRKILVIFFHIGIYTLSSLFYILMNILSKNSNQFVVGQSLTNIWFFLTTLNILAIIAGKYRDVVRQTLVQMPLEVQVDLSQSNAMNV
jgi:hypothetical protein